MEFSERKRSRKSQSFKLVKEDLEAGYFDCNTSADINGEANNTRAATVWLGDKDVEIKNQITGMMRLLNDKAGRMYQRVGKEGENLKQEPQEVDLRWDQHIAISPSASQEDLQHSSWNEELAARPQVSGQYGTRSKTLKMINKMKNTVKTNGEIPITNNPAGPNCCMCNCKTTMQAILQELRAMRKLMQTQKGAQSKQRAQMNVSAQRSPMPRKRNRKRKPAQKVAAPAAHSKKLCSQPGSTTEQCGKRNRPARERPGPTQPTPASTIDTHVPEYCLIREMPSSEPEVQLAEGYEVYIPRTQLDSILVNYTRSGSLLFRKLVCAFFDDTTLANSLPNGKRKRGLNDNRKGLDQNIVGAIKVFTEKYCTANRIDKLPGPRDWVQILQDQIKLARRRLKRGTGEAIVCNEEMDGCSALQSGRAFEKSTCHVWVDADKDCTA
ncbi:BEN domain-containing protein 7 [Polyodon spathula]|uniref:BEN domain-containing protein 7 n=1 Tax=Polyodon spathula TaxID=7913 RepID=UPI001B7EFD36|nr:BEN domain-containing protein 7 [Polyodon spathula]